jgi:hypothetical protein
MPIRSEARNRRSNFRTTATIEGEHVQIQPVLFAYVLFGNDSSSAGLVHKYITYDAGKSYLYCTLFTIGIGKGQ